MANSSYLVIRLVPDLLVDGGTFSANYLGGPLLQFFNTATALLLSNNVYSSPAVSVSVASRGKSLP
jgi:hypothetical protein